MIHHAVPQQVAVAVEAIAYANHAISDGAELASLPRPAAGHDRQSPEAAK